MPPVERIRPDLCQVDVVEAANVDAELFRVRSRHIESMNAAMAAECVLGGQRVELVGGELVLAAQQLEMFWRDDEMQKTFFGADRAVALGEFSFDQSRAGEPSAGRPACIPHVAFRVFNAPL